MPSLTAYLSFNSNCREAMTFYQACMVGNLIFQTLDEYTLEANSSLRNCIVNATLVHGSGWNRFTTRGLEKRK